MSLRWTKKKSSGTDGISNQLLKQSLPYIVESLTHIFNLCIAHNVFPAELKKRELFLYHKIRIITINDPTSQQSEEATVRRGYTPTC